MALYLVFYLLAYFGTRLTHKTRYEFSKWHSYWRRHFISFLEFFLVTLLFGAALALHLWNQWLTHFLIVWILIFVSGQSIFSKWSQSKILPVDLILFIFSTFHLISSTSHTYLAPSPWGGGLRGLSPPVKITL